MEAILTDSEGLETNPALSPANWLFDRSSEEQNKAWLDFEASDFSKSLDEANKTEVDIFTTSLLENVWDAHEGEDGEMSAKDKIAHDVTEVQEAMKKKCRKCNEELESNQRKCRNCDEYYSMPVDKGSEALNLGKKRRKPFICMPVFNKFSHL